MKKRDYILSQQLVNTLNILKGNVQTIMVSIARDKGKIIKGPDNRLNQFFGYNEGIDYKLDLVT